MKLVIVEKSSVAKSIARVIGAAGSKDGSHPDSFSYTILPVFSILSVGFSHSSFSSCARDLSLEADNCLLLCRKE